MSGQFGLWSLPEHWPESPIFTREIKGIDVKIYSRCHGTVDTKDGCACRTLEREGRELKIYTCRLCVEKCLANTAAEARDILLFLRFFWAWRCRTRIAKAARALGADDRILCV